MKVRKAVIPAAGLGIRFLPATKALPKEMIPIVDKPAIQYIVEEIVDSGIQDILIITGRGKRAIEDLFDKSFELNEVLKEKGDQESLKTLEKIEKMADIHYLRQKEAWGTGHAILKAKNHIANEPFAVLYGDDLVTSEVPCIRQLMDLYEKYCCSILAVQKIPSEIISSYGIISGKAINNDAFIVRSLVEKPNVQDAPSNLAFIGRCILDPAIFDILEDMMEKSPPSNGREIKLTDAIQELARTKAVFACEISGKWHTVGDPLSYLMTTIEFALKQNKISSELKTYIIELAKKLSTEESTSTKKSKVIK
ncbi:MAG: UTP--glucose-1-phosphate uridylyltransferase GalU [bacterium]